MATLPKAEPMPALEVAEIPGEFGPVSISERVVQRIWLRQDFMDSGLVTQSAKNLRVRKPGQWNMHEGPDFRDAVLEFDGERIDGDVEIHFYPGDWFDHGHAEDTAFGRVTLHVIVFDDGSRPAFTAMGTTPETLVLLPYLERDLESHASEDALLALERRDHVELLEFYLAQTASSRATDLRDLAFTRWRQKRVYARKRLDKLGWQAACHQAMLEVLGYRRNRIPMIQLAERHAIAAMRNLAADELFSAMEGEWKLAGLRPANHPRKRLAQYGQLIRQNANWPSALADWAGPWLDAADPDEPTAPIRRSLSFSRQRESLIAEVLQNAVGGTRLDTAVVDAFLPLISVAQDRDLFGAWHHWFVGDAPDVLIQFLREAGVTSRTQPRCNGLLQGALQRFFTQGL